MKNQLESKTCDSVIYKSNLFIYLTLISLFIISISYGQVDRGGGYEDNEPMTIDTVWGNLLMGGCFAVIGFLLMLLKSTEGLGKVLIGIGAFIGIGAVILYIIEKLMMGVSMVLSVAFKFVLALVIIYIVVSIFRGIFNLLTGK